MSCLIHVCRYFLLRHRYCLLIWLNVSLLYYVITKVMKFWDLQQENSWCCCSDLQEGWTFWCKHWSFKTDWFMFFELLFLPDFFLYNFSDQGVKKKRLRHQVSLVIMFSSMTVFVFKSHQIRRTSKVSLSRSTSLCTDHFELHSNFF